MGPSYRILEPVGQGGFGTVYRAELLGEGGFTKAVAIKILHEAADAEKRRRLRDEARILGQLRHRAVVQADGLVLLNGRWSVVMELVEGVTLKRAVRAVQRLPWTVAIEAMREVAAALHAAWSAHGPDGHPLRVLHRDIKPSNVQLTRNGEVKILDFGLARAEAVPRESVTTSMRFGSWPYLAPERLDGIDGPAGDVYGLGATLYELLLGEPIGRAYGHPERHERHLEQALGKAVHVVPPEVLSFLGSMLAHDPQVRPSAREVERGCLELLGTCEGPSLLEWCEEYVPALKDMDTPVPDDLTGSILEARTGSRTEDGLTPEPIWRRVDLQSYSEAAILSLAAGSFVAGVSATLALVYLLT